MINWKLFDEDHSMTNNLKIIDSSVLILTCWKVLVKTVINYITKEFDIILVMCSSIYYQNICLALTAFFGIFHEPTNSIVKHF